MTSRWRDRSIPFFPTPVLFSVCAVACILTGCGPRETGVEWANQNGILLMANGTEPEGLDPHVVTGVTENKIISALIEGLISYHPTDDHEPEPGVAERWESSEDKSVWTFFFRENAVWSNGAPVIADHFVQSYERILSPKMAAKYADMLYIVKNARAYREGEIKDFSQVGVKAIDDRTLEISLVGPTPGFLNVLKHYTWFPVHPPTVIRYSTNGTLYDRHSRWAREGNYVGNGPFILTEWRINQIIKVERNPLYWDADTVKLNGIHFFPITNNDTEERAFRSGQVHNTDTLPLDKLEKYRKEKSPLLHIDRYLGTYFYRINTTRKPLDDPRVRHALSMAIDRETICTRVTMGDERPAYGFVPEYIEGYEPPHLVSYNPERARELLAEALQGETFPKMEILINTMEQHRIIAEAIQAMWKRELGIEVGITNMDWKVYLAAQHQLNYDVCRAGWIADFPEPYSMLSHWIKDGGNNNTGWSSPSFEAKLEAATQATSLEENFRILREAEEEFLEAMPVIPLHWYTKRYLLDPSVEGWNPKLLDNRPYKHISVRSS